jgi:hypothetical protein
MVRASQRIHAPQGQKDEQPERCGHRERSHHLQAALTEGSARQRLRLKNRSGGVRDVLLETRLSGDAQSQRGYLMSIVGISEHCRGERLVRAEHAKLLHADRVGRRAPSSCR